MIQDQQAVLLFIIGLLTGTVVNGALSIGAMILANHLHDKQAKAIEAEQRLTNN